jgi:hypothetical protein
MSQYHDPYELFDYDHAHAEDFLSPVMDDELSWLFLDWNNDMVPRESRVARTILQTIEAAIDTMHRWYETTDMRSEAHIRAVKLLEGLVDARYRLRQFLDDEASDTTLVTDDLTVTASEASS